MMDIVFGLWADAGAWPEHGGAADAALGAPVVGPSGLLDILEAFRGLGSPTAPTQSVTPNAGDDRHGSF